jgi:hypothetical protein
MFVYLFYPICKKKWQKSDFANFFNLVKKSGAFAEVYPGEKGKKVTMA